MNDDRVLARGRGPWSVTVDMKLTPFGRRFFRGMLRDLPPHPRPWKANLHRYTR